jgi:hypothetical protein
MPPVPHDSYAPALSQFCPTTEESLENALLVRLLSQLLWWRTNVSWKYSPLCHVTHEELIANLRGTFTVNYFFCIVTRQVLWEIFSFQVQLMC